LRAIKAASASACRMGKCRGAQRPRTIKVVRIRQRYLNPPKIGRRLSLMRPSSLFRLFGPFNQVNKLVCQLPQIALERQQIGTLLCECQKLNGKAP
jgi:hypothetical protein